MPANEGTRPSIATYLPAANPGAATAAGESREAGSASVPVPAVSVVMTVHDHARYFDEAIRSIRAQTLADLELIIVDDGSQDGSGEIADRHALDDPRIRVVHQRQGGVSAARNAGIALARAPWIALADADDVSHPTRLERQVEFVRRNPDLGATATFGRRIGSRGRVLSAIEEGPTSRAAFRAVQAENRVISLLTPSVMLSRDVVVPLGGFRTIRGAGEDVDLWSRIADRHDIVVLPEHLVDYRIHDASISTGRFFIQAETTLLVEENTRRRRSAIPEIDAATFHESLRKGPRIVRIRRRILWQSRVFYRRAGALLADRDPRGFFWLALSLALAPGTALERLSYQLWRRPRPTGDAGSDGEGPPG